MGLTQFRALPVGRGDAYILKSRRGSYLVDGGDLFADLPRMLRERKVGKLRAAVCTFPSVERLGGVLNLMQSGYPVTECWLPARLRTVARMAHAFNGDWTGWRSLFGFGPAPGNSPPPLKASGSGEVELAGGAALLRLALDGALGEVPCGSGSSTPSKLIVMALDVLVDRAASRWGGQAGGVDHLMRSMGRTFLAGGSPVGLGCLCCRLLIEEAPRLLGDNGGEAVIRGLALAAMASFLTSAHTGKVRFFRESDQLKNSLVACHPFVCLNGDESGPEWNSSIPVIPKIVYSEAAKLSGIGRGLVFQFGDGECGVLFCGNSRFGFIPREKPLSLGQPTVIATPSSGGCSADEAYDRIVSGDPLKDVWVRTHVSYARKVADAFKQQPVKVCLHNCVHRTVNEGLFEFSEGRWYVLAGGRCICG